LKIIVNNPKLNHPKVKGNSSSTSGDKGLIGVRILLLAWKIRTACTASLNFLQLLAPSKGAITISPSKVVVLALCRAFSYITTFPPLKGEDSNILMKAGRIVLSSVFIIYSY
jgi:hypothetical protein